MRKPLSFAKLLSIATNDKLIRTLFRPEDIVLPSCTNIVNFMNSCKLSCKENLKRSNISLEKREIRLDAVMFYYV